MSEAGAPRRPGRPRKVAPKVEPDVAEDAWKTIEQPKSSEPSVDERIGQPVDELWESISYADGSSYRCKDGKIVERVT